MGVADHLYKMARWRKRRKDQLARHPFCQSPLCDGKKVPANVADHIEAHNGDPKKFWGGRLQSLCEPCHNGPAQSRDKGGQGFDKGSDVNGNPLIPRSCDVRGNDRPQAKGHD